MHGDENRDDWPVAHGDRTAWTEMDRSGWRIFLSDLTCGLCRVQNVEDDDVIHDDVGAEMAPLLATASMAIVVS